MDFKFLCLHCSQKIAVVRESMGQQVNCPACNSQIVVPTVELPQYEKGKYGLKAILATAGCSMLLTCIVCILIFRSTQTMENHSMAKSASMHGDPTAIKVLSQYLAATDWKQRLNYVRAPDRVKQWMQDYYKGNNGSISFNAITPRNDPALPSDYVAYEVAFPHRNPQIYFLEKSGQDYKVDWDMVVLNHKSTKAFEVEHSSIPEEFRVMAQLATYYNFEFGNQEYKYYSVKLAFPDGETLHGYIEKNSSDGIKLYDLLKDGKEYRVIMSLLYKPVNKDPSVVTIYHFVQPEWIQKTLPPANSAATSTYIAGWYGFGYDYGAAERAANRMFGASNIPNVPALREHLLRYSKGDLSIDEQKAYDCGYQDGLNGTDPEFPSQANPPR